MDTSHIIPRSHHNSAEKDEDVKLTVSTQQAPEQTSSSPPYIIDGLLEMRREILNELQCESDELQRQMEELRRECCDVLGDIAQLASAQPAVVHPAAQPVAAATDSQTLQLLVKLLKQTAIEDEQPCPTLPTFSGAVGEDVEDWISAVEWEAVRRRWDEAKKRRMASFALCDGAAQWERRLYTTELGDWEGFVTALRVAYRPKYSYEEWLWMVNAREQQQEESIATYALTKMQMRKYCPFPISEEEFLPYLIGGLRISPYCKPGLMVHPLRTVQEFIYFAELVDTNFSNISLFRETVAARQIAQELDKLKKSDELNAPFLKNWRDQLKLSPQLSPERPPSGTVCWDCKEFGHVGYFCPRARHSTVSSTSMSSNRSSSGSKQAKWFEGASLTVGVSKDDTFTF